MSSQKISDHRPKEPEKVIDPVCGMDTGKLEKTIHYVWKGQRFSFCGPECRERFEKNPGRFKKEPLIILRDVRKIFQLSGVETQALRGVDLHIWEGDFVVIIGASGSGKSTTLNMMGLLDLPSSGAIQIKGRDTSTLSEAELAAMRSRAFGFVFQQFNLIPWLTAFENVALPPLFARQEVNEKKLISLFKDIGLEERMAHRPKELSGGEQQRVALLRALANNPDIIIADEPTGNLDSETGEKILKMLIDLNQQQKKTLIIVTHDASIAKRADQIITLKDGIVVANHRAHMAYI